MSADRRTFEKTYVYLAVAWGFFGVLHVLQGHPWHASIALGEAVIFAGAYRLRHQIGADRSTHLLMGLCVVGFSVASLVSGQGASVSLWWMALLPVMAGFLLGGRAARAWLVVVVMAITLVHLSSRWVIIEPELISTERDLWSRQVVIAVLGVLAGSATVGRLRSQRRQLTEARDQAAAAVKARTSFLAGVSHELRTPLTGLLGMTEIMRTEPDGPAREATIDEIVRNGEVLARLIEQLLEFSRIDEAGGDLVLGVHDPRELLEDALLASAPTAWDKNISLVHVVGEDVEGLVRVDGQRLRQVVSNLVNNAVKYTPEGFVQVTLSREGDLLVVEVQDSGPGLSPQEIELALVPFKRLKHGPIPGTGLGLPSVQAWCRSMGGRLEIHSALGEGTTVVARVRAEQVASASPGGAPVRVQVDDERLRASLENALAALNSPASARLHGGLVEVTTPAGTRLTRWPARLRRLATATPVSEPRALTDRARKVVVVDDVPVVRAVATRFVERLGASVVAFPSGREALVHLASNDADLVLLDMWLDGELGPEVARQMHEAWPDLRVVAMSASVQAEDRAAWQDVGVTDFLAKPIDVEQLEVILRSTTRPPLPTA